MQTINLRNFYPFYTHDCFIEVSDEVAQALAEAERLERNYMRRMFYNIVRNSSPPCRLTHTNASIDVILYDCDLCLYTDLLFLWHSNAPPMFDSVLFHCLS